MPARLLRSPIAWLVVVLVGLEILASRLLPYRRLEPARIASRNALARHGWPEYVSAGPSPEGRLAVIVSHSQGVGVEIEDGSRIYAARLRERLGRARPADFLENWSVPGLRTVDLEVLSLQAADRGAHVVLFVVAFANLDARRKIDLTFPDGDVPLIAARVSLWPWIPDTLFSERLGGRTVVEMLAAAHSDLVRSRGEVRALAAAALPVDERGLVLGRTSRRLGLDALARPGARHAPTAGGMAHPGALPVSRAFRVRRAETAQALATLRRLYPRLRDRLRRQGVRDLWIWSPAATGWLTPRDLERLRAFHREAAHVIEEAGGRCLDLSEAIPAERFYSRGHLDEEGHRLMSRLLWPVILDELR